ncbi:small lysine-rich protein 1 [Polyodon spathula]|uniref:small lysine-rich protein 1 n=1 Tax=Polyodon spathula TaxID=7913 RepID=UPI001B7E1BB9|nr:small lysine-rich protein 1 [Polyodon spathula]XP_041114455.1 small lysine-rich protein 1 [Polyodon spathula]
MPHKSGKKKSHSANPGKRKKPSKKRSLSSKSPKPEVDILGPVAMENLYYISHNAADCLAFRGFGWSGSPKKKGKKS